MAQILGDTPEGHYARAYFYRMRRQPQRMAEVLRLAIDQFPADTVLRKEFLRNHFGDLARASAPPEIAEVAAGITGPGADLLKAAQGAAKNDWGQVAAVDARLAEIPWS